MEQLNLVSKLSLNEMALRRVVVNLYESSISAAVVGELDSASWFDNEFILFKIIKVAKEKVSKLVLPESLKKMMMDLGALVHSEIISWKVFHQHLLSDISLEVFDKHIFEQLCWTCTGTVDYRNTAEELVRLETLGIEKRYRLACWYCLEDYIPVLWVELPEKYKSRFNDEVYPLPENVVHLEYYWASVLKGEEFKLNYILPRIFVNVSFTYQSFFTYSVYQGSKAATEYFYQKLTDEERNIALYSVLCAALGRTTRLFQLPSGLPKLRSDVLCYLLSLMTHEQQIQVFKKHPSDSLICFLYWPWQDLFLDVADLIWNFLPESQYDFVRQRLFDNMFDLRTFHYLPELFHKFFMRSPINFRKCFVDGECRDEFSFLFHFTRVEDAEYMKVVLGNLDAGDRMRLLSHRRFFCFLDVLMSKDKWHLVELFVGEAVLSKEDRMILKEAYMGFPKCAGREGEWKRFFELLNGTNVSTNSSKCPEDETLTKAKRLSSGEEKGDLAKKLKRH